MSFLSFIKILEKLQFWQLAKILNLGIKDQNVQNHQYEKR